MSNPLSVPAREPSRPAATYVRLKGAEEMAQERVLGAEGEHLPLDQRTVDVVVLQHDVLLQALDRVVVVGVFQLGQKHLPEKMGWVNKSRLAQARVKGSGSVAKKKKLRISLDLTLPKLPLPSTVRKWKSSTLYFRKRGITVAGAVSLPVFWNWAYV